MVAILLADGFETAEALCPCDVLRRAGIEVALVGVTGRRVTSGQGVTVEADAALSDVSAELPELVMLPGGLQGVRNLRESPEAMRLLHEMAAAGRYVTAICAAPTVLGAEGLLVGKRAVCYPGMEDGLTGAVVCAGERVVVDGNIVTAEAAGSSIAFGLKLVELLRGSAAAEKVRRGIHY